MADPRHIRPIAICVFRCADCILVGEGHDPTKRQTFHRPVGGEIGFGETSERAMLREISEEIGSEIRDLRPLGVLENLFTFDGETGHEIVFVFDATLCDAGLYHQPAISGVESDGAAFRAIWRDIACPQEGQPPLYPDGLRELLLR